MGAASVPRDLLNRQAPVRNGTRTSSRANAVSFGHHRATTGASSRRGPAERVVFCSSALLETPGGTQSSGGSPPNGPRPGKQAGGDDDPQGRGEAPGLKGAVKLVGRWLRHLDANVWATFFAGTGFVMWHTGLATTADVDQSEKRTKEHLDEVKKSVDQSEERTKELLDEVKKSVDQSEERTKERLDEVKDSLKFVVTWQYSVAFVGVFAVGIIAGTFVPKKGS